MGALEEVAFYAVSDAAYFGGLVALLNSLRMRVSGGKLIVLDTGLTPDQRALLAPHCTILDRPDREATHPTLYKAYAHTAAPEGIVVLTDSDLVITGSLAPLFAEARAGRICAFSDPNHERFFPEWQKIFSLDAELRPQTYVSAGFVVFSTEHWPDLLARWWRACEAILASPEAHGGKWGESSPVNYADQDALNALLMSEIPAGALSLIPIENRPVGTKAMRATTVDPSSLRSTFDGREMTLVHCDPSPKSFEPDARGLVRRDAYVLLLRRLLTGDDVALKLSGKELPVWLRRGIGGHMALRFLDVTNRMRTRMLAAAVPAAKRALPTGPYRKLQRWWRSRRPGRGPVDDDVRPA